MASGVPRSILTHSQRVCRLYKQALKTTYNWCTNRTMFRYQACLLRARFDATRTEKDYRKLAAMVEEAEEELWRVQHPQPFVYKDDPEGIIQYRTAHPSDDVLDSWHPWEKAQFIDYFETRQKRKDDFIKYYENHISKKFEKPVSNLEFPVRGPHI